MRLFLPTPVFIAALIVSTIAIPPSNHSKETNNEKPSYEYKYAIEDPTGDGHGKFESRDGEKTTGRYYINSKRSLTNVKYTADEWGYHPIVQYGLSDNQSTSTTAFAMDEKPIVTLPSKNIVHSNSNTVLPGDKIQLVQIFQPHHRSNENIEDGDIFLIRSNETWTPDDSTVTVIVPDFSLEPITNSIPTNTLNLNYVNNLSEKKQNRQLSPYGDKIYVGKDHELSTSQSNVISALENDLSTSEEDQLVIENAGNFGERLKSKDILDVSVSTSTTSPISIYSDKPVLSSTIRDTNYFHGSVYKKNNKPYLPNIIPGLGAYSSTTFPFQDNSVTDNSIESESVRNQDKSSIENSKWKSYTTLSNRFTGSNFGTTRNPPFKNYASKNLFSSFSKLTNEALDKKKEYVFSKPIVVQDVPKETSFQYSTTFECEDASSSTPDPILSKKNTSTDTTSSYILNSIQAGVALVNAGDTHLITNDINSSDKITDSIHEKVQKPSESNIVKYHEQNYLGPQIALTGYKNINNSDSIVEVQKSIEIEHNNPITQYYESSTIFSDLKHTDRQQSTTNKNPQQQIFVTNNAESNTKQLHGSRTRGEPLSKIYEITDAYSKDLSGEKPIYVIPPATYIIDDSSIFKNSLLQEKLPHYQGDLLEVDSTIKSKEQKISITNSITKSSRPPISGISYDTEIQHEHQQNFPSKSINNYELPLKKQHHVSYAQPVEQIIDKNLPYQVEKLVEKKVPIYQTYSIPIQVPVSQTIPFHIEKTVERKIPVSVHIPISHSYPIEKQIHVSSNIEDIAEKPVHMPINVEKKVPILQMYPVDIEKLVERRIPYPIELPKYLDKAASMQAPYGVQYGVSYQQIMKPQNNGLYSHQSNKVAPLYALPSTVKHSFGSNFNNITKILNNANVNNLNHSQVFHGYIYDKPVLLFNDRKENTEKHHFPNNKVSGKIFTYNPYVPSYSLPNLVLHRRYNDKQRLNKPERDEYYGPVPPPHHHRQFGFQSKAFPSFQIPADRTQIIRKSRNYEPVRYQKGNFRQSKMEYGFKPPMVPSIQYDEETASKVER